MKIDDFLFKNDFEIKERFENQKIYMALKPKINLWYFIFLIKIAHEVFKNERKIDAERED